MSAALPSGIRLLTHADLPAVRGLQAQCYPEPYQEPEAAFAAKLRASPATAWGVAAQRMPGGEPQLAAYLFALPVQGLQWPGLHAAFWSAPAQPDGLYLHDLALHPAARGQGWAQRLLAVAREHAVQQGWTRLVLVAVQGSEPFWSRQGFARVPSIDLAQAGVSTASFGEQACAMWANVSRRPNTD